MGGDILEQLWTGVINVEPAGRWIDRVIDECAEPQGGRYSGCAAALQRLRAGKVAVEDLGRLARFVRYESCFSTLMALEDPGLKKRKIAGLHKALSDLKPDGRSSVEPKFFEALTADFSSLEDEAEFLINLAKAKTGDGPFDDTGPAVKRLLKAGAAANDLAAVVAWQRFDAAVQTLRLLESSGLKSTDETEALHEMLLGADPSGNEGRPGSWPIPVKPKPKTNSQGNSEPLWKIRSAQALAFSPDSKTLAIAGASSPVRLFDLESGKERLTCEGVKVHIYRIAFSPDGKQVAAGHIHNAVTICDAASGKLLHRFKRDEAEISALAYSCVEELMCAAWQSEILFYDAKTGARKMALVIEGARMVDHAAFSSDGRYLAVLWSMNTETGHNALRLNIWSWPERQRLVDLEVKAGLGEKLAWVPGREVVAVSNCQDGILFFDATTGKAIGATEPRKNMLLSFTPDGTHFVTGEKNDDLLLWDTRTRKTVRCIAEKVGAVEGTISPNGKLLAVTTFHGAKVWKLN